MNEFPFVIKLRYCGKEEGVSKSVQQPKTPATPCVMFGSARLAS